MQPMSGFSVGFQAGSAPNGTPVFQTGIAGFESQKRRELWVQWRWRNRRRRVGPRFAANAYLGRNSSRSRLNVTRLASAGPDRGR